MTRRRVCASILAVAICAAGAAWAAEYGPTWTSLTPAQQAALAPLRSEWAGIDEARKEKWLAVANRFPKMTPAERDRIQARMTDWVRKTPEERGRARLQFQEARTLSAEDRQARWQAYQSLPPEQREALARRSAPAAPGREARAAQRAPSGEKSNVVKVVPQTAAPTKPVAPTIVQARPGATTSSLSKQASPPVPSQHGLPKITATQGFVDPSTMLPRRGPQAAAVAQSPAASGANSRTR
jgi:hypothetical protein